MERFRIARHNAISLLMHYEEPIAHAPYFKIPWKGDAEQIAHCSAWQFFDINELRACDQYTVDKLKESQQDRIQRRNDRYASEEHRNKYFPSWELQDKRELREDIIYIKKKERERLMRLNSEPPNCPPLTNTVSEWDQ